MDKKPKPCNGCRRFASAALCAWIMAASLTVAMYYNQRTINLQRSHIDLLQRRIDTMEWIMRGNDQMLARKAVNQFAMTRAMAWLHQHITTFQFWVPHVGPYVTSSDHEGLVFVTMGWHWEATRLALQLQMPALGDIEQSLWFVPKSLDTRGLIEYAHPCLFRLLRPTEWETTEQALASLFSAATAISGASPVLESSARPVTTTHALEGSTHR